MMCKELFNAQTPSPMVRVITVLVLLPLLIENVAHGKQNMNQPCILGNAEPGRCIRSEQCLEIANIKKRNTFYQHEIQQIQTAIRACGSDENESDPLVCCESSSGSRRMLNEEAASTTTTTIAPTRRATRTRVTKQRSTTRRVLVTSPTIITSTSTVRYDRLKDVLPAQCGFLPPFSLAWGGVEDEENIHAWTVYLEIQRPKTTGRCVGTLIHERFVLTVAHCVHTSQPKNIKLYFGLVLRSKLQQCLTDGVCQERQAAELITHQDYNSHSQLNDVALIRLGEAVNFSDDVRPACLPLDHLFDENMENDTRVVSVGWGEYEGGRTSDSKRIVQLQVIGKERCKEQLRKRQRFNISMIYSVMCTTGVQAGHDVCMGDSGAPMLQYRDRQYFVLGLASFGPRCGMESDKAGVWMRLSEYINWILANLKRNDNK